MGAQLKYDGGPIFYYISKDQHLHVFTQRVSQALNVKKWAGRREPN